MTNINKLENRLDTLEAKLDEVKQEQSTLKANLEAHQKIEESEFKHIRVTLDSIVKANTDVMSLVQINKQVTAEQGIRIQNNEKEIDNIRANVKDIYTKLSTMNYKAGVIAGTISIIVSIVLFLIK